jgi:ubiquinone/menaquinone biosynthesis C-methylase UbiE
MTGVRLGDRLVYLGAGDAAMFAALAAKVGLTGRARALVESEAASERIKEAAARAGVLIEVAIADFQALALDDGAFDIAVIDATAGVVPRLSASQLTAAGAALLRALRPRGRAIVVERDKKGWLAAFKGRPEGVDAEVVKESSQIKDALARAKRANVDGRPYLLDIHVERDGVGAASAWHPSYSIAAKRTRRV